MIGMMLAHNEGVSAGDKITAPESGAALSTIGGSQRAQDAATALSGAPGAAISDPLDHSFMNEDLDNIQEQLEAQLQHWSAWGMDGHTD